MKKRLTVWFAAAALVTAMVTATAVPALAGTVKGSAPEPNNPQFGQIDYLFNKAGYHFWFTMSGDKGFYEAGHSYHNVYKYREGSPPAGSDFCGSTVVPDALPYNAGGTAGENAWWKVWDVTDEVWVCP